MISVPQGEGCWTGHSICFSGVLFRPSSFLRCVFSCGRNAPRSQSASASFRGLSGERCPRSWTVCARPCLCPWCWNHSLLMLSFLVLFLLCLHRSGNVLNLEQPALNHIFLSKRTAKGPGIFVCVWHFCSLIPISLSRPRSCFVFFFGIIWLWFSATQTDLSACSLKSNKLLIAFPNYPVYGSCRLEPLLV